MAAGNPLNEELKQKILSIDGVTDIIPSRQSCLLYTSHSDGGRFAVYVQCSERLSGRLQSVDETDSGTLSDGIYAAVSYTHLDVYKRQSEMGGNTADCMGICFRMQKYCRRLQVYKYKVH